WGDILGLGTGGLDTVSVTASFFELGGHSLLLAKLQSSINDQFGLSVPIRTLFERNTVRTQAQLIDIYQLENDADAFDESDEEEMEIDSI
ncbi:MAG: phosphopantetheine-binding protein, partial [Psychrosphaera sp.]|nr:phosphopantetheine-binding protein [Psychrosphaera sp.]